MSRAHVVLAGASLPQSGRSHSATCSSATPLPWRARGVEYELIVVPNASQDGTADVVHELARHDPRHPRARESQPAAGDFPC